MQDFGFDDRFELKGVVDWQAIESFLWVTPLRDDWERYFSKTSYLGLPLIDATYSYKEEKFNCSLSSPCLLTAETIRAHWTYGESWISAKLRIYAANCNLCDIARTFLCYTFDVFARPMLLASLSLRICKT